MSVDQPGLPVSILRHLTFTESGRQCNPILVFTQIESSQPQTLALLSGNFTNSMHVFGSFYLEKIGNYMLLNFEVKLILLAGERSL